VSYTRLNININRETAASLLRRPADQSMTETVRRAVAVYGLLYEQVDAGGRVLLVNGCAVREIKLEVGADA